MIFKPASFADGRRALAATVLLLAVVLLLALQVLASATGGGSFLLLLILLALLALAGYLAWRAWVCLSLAYWIDRNAVTVVWGPLRQVIPLSQIEQVRRGAGEVECREPRLERWLARWPRWPQLVQYGPHLGRALRWQDRSLVSLASRPPAEQLLLVTPGGAFGISPADPDRFLLALQEHHQLGPTRLLRVERHHPGLAHWPLWQDRLGLGLLMAGLVGGLILLGSLMMRYPAVAGADRDALFWLPVFGFAVWAVNGLWGALVYGRQRLAARLLWGGALVAQAATLAALLTLTAR